MTKNEMAMNAYREEMFERQANGIKTHSFAEWKRRKEAMRVLFETIESRALTRSK
jgi:hypothetical protein